MRIIIGESNGHNMENVGNEVVLRKEQGTTFVPESEEDVDKLKVIVEQFLGITKDKKLY